MSNGDGERVGGHRFLQRPEGRIFVAGCCMLIVWVELLALLSLRYKHPAGQQLLTMGLAHLAGGRLAAITSGFACGLNVALVAAQATYMDIMTMFIMYPIMIFSYQNFFERRIFQAHVRPLFAVAQKRVGRMRRYKIIGVFMFVWFPLWMTGIIVGALLGFLLGLRQWVNMLTVCLGSATAVVCWVLAFDKLRTWLEGIGKGFPFLMSTLIIGGLIALRVINMKREIRLANAKQSGTDGDT